MNFIPSLTLFFMIYHTMELFSEKAEKNAKCFGKCLVYEDSRQTRSE